MATLRGWPAVVVLVLLVGFVIVRGVTVRSTLAEDARVALEEQIRLDYARRLLAETADAPMDAAGAEALLATRRIELVSLEVRGPLDDLVARVEATLDGGVPPGEDAVSYWRLEYSRVMGWRVRGRTDRVAWWLAVI